MVKTRKNILISPSNIFPQLHSIHFSSNGSFNKPGLKFLIKNLKDHSSELFNSFGLEGSELFYSYYIEHKSKPKDFTVIARDILLANTILFNELDSGPASSTVRQSEHLLSMVLDKKSQSILKKKLISLVIIPDDDLFFKPIFDSFMSIYLRDTSLLGIGYDALFSDLLSLLIFSRAQLFALRELDNRYSLSKDAEKKKLFSISREYLRRLSIGSFSGPLSISGFFSERGLFEICNSLNDSLASNKALFENLCESHKQNYSGYVLRAGIVHSRLDDLKNNIEEHIKSYRPKRKFS